MKPTTTYTKALQQHLATGQATEHTYRSTLEALIEALGDDVTAGCWAAGWSLLRRCASPPVTRSRC